jgi:plastocyanin
MKTTPLSKWIVFSMSLASGLIFAQSNPSPGSQGELRLRLVSAQPATHHAVPAVAWLDPLTPNPSLSALPHGHATLLQKNRMFVPHLQVIPVGTVVQFPNADPFFHNVFSLFNGKRFDLGLYEAGSSKSVTFSREGVSYIFCNIHPEMSAVVLALSTPLYAVADQKDDFVLSNIPAGDYTLHIWVEGVPQAVTERLSRRVQVPEGSLNLGAIRVPAIPNGNEGHSNKFGNPYDPSTQSPYAP